MYLAIPQMPLSIITLDITCYFDSVNHNRLPEVLRSTGRAIQICKWDKSFVNNRIRIDGVTDRPKAVKIGCP